MFNTFVECTGFNFYLHLVFKVSEIWLAKRRLDVYRKYTNLCDLVQFWREYISKERVLNIVVTEDMDLNLARLRAESSEMLANFWVYVSKTKQDKRQTTNNKRHLMLVLYPYPFYMPFKLLLMHLYVCVYMYASVCMYLYVCIGVVQK